MTGRESAVLREHIAAWHGDTNSRTRRALSRILFQLPDMANALAALDNPSNGPAEMAEYFDAYHPLSA